MIANNYHRIQDHRYAWCIGPNLLVRNNDNAQIVDRYYSRLVISDLPKHLLSLSPCLTADLMARQFSRDRIVEILGVCTPPILVLSSADINDDIVSPQNGIKPPIDGSRLGDHWFLVRCLLPINCNWTFPRAMYARIHIPCTDISIGRYSSWSTRTILNDLNVSLAAKQHDGLALINRCPYSGLISPAMCASDRSKFHFRSILLPRLIECSICEDWYRRN